MIYLRADFSKKLNCRYSIFASFQYNPTYVELIKGLKFRSWNQNTKEWEIGQDSYDDFMEKLSLYGILYNEEDFRKTVNELKAKVAKLQAIQTTEKQIDASILDKIDFKTEPRSYQKEGIAYGLQDNCFLLADEQGLGKTLQCINIARLKKGGQHCLIIVGYSTLLFNWVEEIRKHSNEDAYVLGQRKVKNKIKQGSMKDRLEDIQNFDNIKEFFIVTSVVTLRECIKSKYIDKNGKEHKVNNYYFADALENLCREGKIGRIIIDEGQVFRNMSNQTEALLRLRSCPYKIVATGTPLMNKHIDLYPIMTWLNMIDMNFFEFRNKFCVMGGFKNKQIIGNQNGDILNSILASHMLRRRKDDVLDLPEKIFINEKLEMDLKQESLYEKTKKAQKQQLVLKKYSKTAQLSAYINLRKVTSHPAWIDDSYKDSVKFDRVFELLKDFEENNQKAVIFSNWTTPLYLLKEKIECYNPAMIVGDTKDRMEEVRKFQEDESCRVILGTIGAMGTGLTLTAGSNVIFLDEPWNRAIKDQCCDRCHRIGTKSNVNIYTLMCKGTVDEKVHRKVYEKGIIQDNVVDGIPLDDLRAVLEEEFDE